MIYFISFFSQFFGLLPYLAFKLLKILFFDLVAVAYLLQVSCDSWQVRLDTSRLRDGLLLVLLVLLNRHFEFLDLSRFLFLLITDRDVLFLEVCESRFQFFQLRVSSLDLEMQLLDISNQLLILRELCFHEVLLLLELLPELSELLHTLIVCLHCVSKLDEIQHIRE